MPTDGNVVGAALLMLYVVLGLATTTVAVGVHAHVVVSSAEVPQQPQVLTIAPSDGHCNSTDPDVNRCSDMVQAFLDACCAAGSSCVVHVQPGVYYLQRVSTNPGAVSALWLASTCAARLVQISGPPNVTDVHGGPAAAFVIMDLIGFFSGYGAPGGGGAASVVDVVFSHFSIDMLRVPYTYGTVVGSSTVRIAAAQVQSQAFQLNASRFPYIAVAQAINTYSLAEERWTADLDDYRLSDPVTLAYTTPDSATGDVLVTLSAPEGSPAPPDLLTIVGQTVILRHQVYSINAFTMSNVQVAMDHVEVYAIGGMGIYCSRCYTIALTNFRISPPRDSADSTEARRPVSICADGIHVCNQAVGHRFSLVDSRIEAQGDDCLNINAPMARIVNISADRSTITATGYDDSNPPIANGDTVNVMDRTTLEFTSQVGNVRVASGNQISAPSGATWSASVVVGDLVYASSAMTTAAVITGTYFGKNRARGMLIRGEHFMVSGNVFDRTSGMAVLVVIDGCTFFEGPLLYNFTFASNVVANVNLGPASSYAAITAVGNTPQFSPDGVPAPGTCYNTVAIVFLNFTIADNTFLYNISNGGGDQVPVTGSVHVEVTDGVVVAGNLVSRSNGAATPPCELQALHCLHATADNTNVCNGAACSTCGF